MKWLKDVGNGKRFTNVVKTIANSTTYCRKQGDCNGTIIFEVDIMKNSSLLNLKFTIFVMSKPKWHFFSAGLTALSAQLLSVTEKIKTKETTKIFVKKLSLTKI